MAQTSLRHNCPHCGTRGSGFDINYRRSSGRQKQFSYALATCGICDRPIALEYQDILEGVQYSGVVDIAAHNVDFPDKNFLVHEIWPASTEDVPSDLPKNVANFFLQGIRNEKAEQWDAAGAMLRKSLDVATKCLDPSLAGKSLFERINTLAKAGRLTADLATWAHEVRIGGNSSVHDDDPETKEDVAAIHEFCRAVLLYSFTLPALVATRSSRSVSP